MLGVTSYNYSCAGTNTNTTDDNQHCEEWPLALSYDLRTDERINTVLYWDDLQAIEREYVQRIEQGVAAAVEQVEGIYFNCSWLWLWQQDQIFETQCLDQRHDELKA